METIIHTRSLAYTAVFLCLAYLIFRWSKGLSERRAETAIGISNGCLPQPQLPNSWPLGLDWIRKLWQSDSEQQLLAFLCKIVRTPLHLYVAIFIRLDAQELKRHHLPLYLFAVLTTHLQRLMATNPATISHSTCCLGHERTTFLTPKMWKRYCLRGFKTTVLGSAARCSHHCSATAYLRKKDQLGSIRENFSGISLYERSTKT